MARFVAAPWIVLAPFNQFLLHKSRNLCIFVSDFVVLNLSQYHPDTPVSLN